MAHTHLPASARIPAAPPGPRPALRIAEADDAQERVARAAARAIPARRPGAAAEPPPPRQPATTPLPGASTPATSSGQHLAPPAVSDLLASPGTPLAEPWLSDMQAAFGHHFGEVRVHAGPAADHAARLVQAKAFTVGQHMVFANGQLAPQTTAGRQLLAHELAHVVQQGQGAAPTLLQRDASDDDPDIAVLLRAADRAAKGTTAADLVANGSEVVYRLIAKYLENHASLISGVGPDTQIKGIAAQKGKGNRFSISFGKDFVQGITAANLPTRAAQIRAALDQLGAKPRQDYVFIMGEDRKGQPNQFYLAAEKYYATKLPQAQMIKNRQNLEAVLDYVANTIKEPVGSLYIVSHANEDGTLSFPVNAADQDNKTSVGELNGMLHPEKGGSKLTKVGNKIDAYSKVRIKGCDIGRTQQMVELLDEAFGGEGTVTAPTHEQRFDYDSAKATAASKDFRAAIIKDHPEPKIDEDLKKKNPAKAKQALAKAKAERNKEIRDEIKARADEETQVMDQAAVFEEFSGPMFQRPGTTLFTKDELAGEVKALYPHLDVKQQAALVKELLAADRRPANLQKSQGTFQQQGMRLDRKRMDSFTFIDPQNISEIKLIWAQDFAKNRFTATSLVSTGKKTTDKGEMITGKIEGTQPVKGEKQPQTTTFDIAWKAPPDEKALLASSRAKLGNPERYDWRIETVHSKNGQTTKTAIGERVITYLHHHSLRASPNKPFDRPESDPRFTATSTFSPADAKNKGGKP